MNDYFKKNLIFWIIPVLIIFLFYFKQIIFSVLFGIIIGSVIQFLALYLTSRLKINFYLSISLIYAISIFLIVFTFYLSLKVILEEIPNFIPKTLPIIERFKDFLPNNWQEIFTGRVNYLSFGFDIFIKFFGGLFSVVYAFIISIYISLDRKFPKNLLELFFNEESLENIFKIWKKIRLKIAFWFVGELFLMLFIGIVVYIFTGLIFKIKYALLVALVAGILEFIPIIGPLISLIISVFVVIVENPEYILPVTIFFILLQQFENHFLVPIVMKKAISIDPVLIILAISIAGKIGGVFGIISVIPLLGIFIELKHHIKMRDSAIGSTQDSGS